MIFCCMSCVYERDFSASSADVYGASTTPVVCRSDTLSNVYYCSHWMDDHGFDIFCASLVRNHAKCYLVFSDFATVSGCDQLVVGPTHARGGTLDLLMTDVPDLVRVAVVTPIGNSDHSSLSAAISMAQAVPNLFVSRKVFLKHQVNWNIVCGAVRELPCVTLGFLTILLRF